MDIFSLAAHFATHYILFMDSDEEDDKQKLIKIKDYAEFAVPNYTGRQFFIHFQMSREVFQTLLSKLVEISPQQLRGGNAETPLEKQLLITIWYMANLESFRSVADRFGLSTYTSWSCFYKICHNLLELNRREKIIVWPDEWKCQSISEAFERKHGFPGIVGAIDGSHIPIKSPPKNSASYINRKGFPSVLLQAVCDHKCSFIDCYAGEVGSVHDACLFIRSALGQNFNNMVFSNDGHILGDSAYPLLKNLMVPYKDNGHLHPIQVNYNKTHSKCRVVIEQAFALLKGRFRRLKLLENTKTELVPLVIISACIMHNVCNNFDDNELVNIEGELQEEEMMNIPGEELYEQENINEAIVKRNDIANALYRPPM